ncbi:uncharacterized protein LOC119382343 [Rhipicephalus sanguineus]|uniref:uncharacterized protein LOC119382343 n=1 Tax=Rhipicephalus sanguineus TaxID=34632 RepID=UPI001894F602|nr:uncharacterized protein LOC119382343 [Rhipicephalus sanguineus]
MLKNKPDIGAKAFQRPPAPYEYAQLRMKMLRHPWRGVFYCGQPVPLIHERPGRVVAIELVEIRAVHTRVWNRDSDGKEPNPPPPFAPRRQKSLIRFLLPRLYDRRYGQDLEWTDEEEGIFRIRWARHPWISQREPPVQLFKDWSVRLRKWNEEDPKNLDKAKDRIRISLLHTKYVEKLNQDDQSYRWFKVDNRQLLDDTKRRLRLKQQMRDGILSHVKYCYIHKTSYAPCCCPCSTWSEPPKPIFEDQQDATYACEEFELFCTQMAPHVRCWYKMDDFGEVELTGGGAPIPTSDFPGSIPSAHIPI